MTALFLLYFDFRLQVLRTFGLDHLRLGKNGCFDLFCLSWGWFLIDLWFLFNIFPLYFSGLDFVWFFGVIGLLGGFLGVVFLFPTPGRTILLKNFLL